MVKLYNDIVEINDCIHDEAVLVADLTDTLDTSRFHNTYIDETVLQYIMG